VSADHGCIKLTFVFLGLPTEQRQTICQEAAFLKYCHIQEEILLCEKYSLKTFNVIIVREVSCGFFLSVRK